MNAQVDTDATVVDYMYQLGRRARAASRVIGAADSASKNSALIAIADALLAQQAQLLAENQKDITAGQANQLAPALLDRLELTENRIETMAQGLREIAALPDPVGEITGLNYRPQRYTGRQNAGTTGCNRYYL